MAFSRTRESSATISVLLVWPILEAARKLELELNPERFGLDPRMFFDADQKVSHEAADQLLQHAVSESGRLDFPLVAASSVRSGHFGLLEVLAHAQPTAGESLEILQHFGTLLCDGVEFHVEHGSVAAKLRMTVRSDLALHPASYEYALALIWVISQNQTSMPLRSPNCVQLPYRSPRDATHLERFFGCPVEFDAAEACAVLPASYWELPMRRSSAMTRAALEEAAQSLLSQCVHETGFIISARNAVRRSLGTGTASAPHVARHLGLSERTLRRRLRDDGTSFRAVLDSVRCETALELLARRELSTDVIAELLQFSTPQAFHRAFRKWTGMTVASARAQLSAGPSSPLKR